MLSGATPHKEKEMRRIGLLVFVVISCSSSVAQEPDMPVIETAVKVVKAVPRIVKTIEEKPQPKKVSHTDFDEFAWLSKVCVSEGGFDYEECARILQTLDNMRGNAPLSRALFAQSAFITRRKPFVDPRQIWVSYLPMRGEGPPSMGWIECTAKKTPTNCTGTWKYIGKKWVEFRDKVRDLYYSNTIPNLVPGKPIQWGGDMDYWRGVERSFCPLNVGDKFHNTFWGNPRDPANTGKCLPIDKVMIARSKKLTESILGARTKQAEQIKELLVTN